MYACVYVFSCLLRLAPLHWGNKTSQPTAAVSRSALSFRTMLVVVKAKVVVIVVFGRNTHSLWQGVYAHACQLHWTMIFKTVRCELRRATWRCCCCCFLLYIFLFISRKTRLSWLQSAFVAAVVVAFVRAIIEITAAAAASACERQVLALWLLMATCLLCCCCCCCFLYV